MWRLYSHAFRLPLRRSFASSYNVSVERADFAYLTDKDLNHFRSLIGTKNVLVEELDSYNTDWMKWYKGFLIYSILYCEF